MFSKSAQYYDEIYASVDKDYAAEVNKVHAFIQKHQQTKGKNLLDVACGTGLLLKQLFAQVPDMEVYGIDASADMLAQARAALQDYPDVHLEHLRIEKGMASNLPYPQDYFDLITCTNALHDIPEAASLLTELGKLLTPEGQLVVEDFSPRQPRLLWASFAWFLQLIEGNKVHAYTLKNAKLLCTQAGLRVDREKVFTIDWLWHGWIISANWPASVADFA